MWDYGSAAENLAHYNKTKPPVYQYTGLQVPTIFFSGGNDYLGQFTITLIWNHANTKLYMMKT